MSMESNHNYKTCINLLHTIIAVRIPIDHFQDANFYGVEPFRFLVFNKKVYHF